MTAGRGIKALAAAVLCVALPCGAASACPIASFAFPGLAHAKPRGECCWNPRAAGKRRRPPATVRCLTWRAR